MNGQPNPPAPGQGQPPPLSQDLASLANILTQIQYDLFDVSVQLAQPPDPDKPFNSRIDQQAITDINLFFEKYPDAKPDNYDQVVDYLQQLNNLLFIIFRWSNLIMGEK